MRLRYTGPWPVSFPALGLEVEPGTEFDAPDQLAEGLLRRPDIEAAPPAPSPKARRRAKDPDPTETAGQGPELNEEADGGVPDHS